MLKHASAVAMGLTLALSTLAHGQFVGGQGAQIADGLYDPISVSHPSCAPLAPPAGPTIQIGPANADTLPSTILNAASGTVIVLEDGVYTFSFQDEASRRLRFETPNVTLTSLSQDATRVIIDGEYLTNEMAYITASNITISHITFTRAVDHLIHLTPTTGVNSTNVKLYGLRLIDSGEQFIKGNPNPGRTAWPDDTEVACSVFMLTDDGRPNVSTAVNGCYTGGIDVHGGRDWHVHHNYFGGIYCKNGSLAEHAVHFWRGARDTLVEQNIIVNGARGIGFGLASTGETRPYNDNPCPGANGGYVGHHGGIIRGNIIYAEHAYYDAGISLEQACGVEVLHNTVFETSDASNGFSSIEYRYDNTDALIQNNITRLIRQRNNGSATTLNNIQDAKSSLFVRPDARKLGFQLRASATSAVNQGAATANAGVDLEGNARNNGNPDIGALERQ
ncbi:MAG: hypothetical protein ACE366_26785 [Bradymonadia bacterium]